LESAAGLAAEMQDRPDLIQSELAGLAFDSLQQVFRRVDIAYMFDSPPLPPIRDQMIWTVIDPAAGGPQSDYAVVSLCRQKGCVTVLSIDVLSGCKEPEKQFALVERHIDRIRDMELYRLSPIVIMVERNLGFESEHHEKALRNLPNCRHRIDHQAKRFGILTTEDIKYGMMTLLNTMLRDNRVNVAQPLLSEDPEGNRRRLKDQMGIYSFQYKDAANAFGKQRVSLNGKVGGMKGESSKRFIFSYNSR